MEDCLNKPLDTLYLTRYSVLKLSNTAPLKEDVMENFEIGQEVVRSSGEAAKLGDRGIVVDISGGRVRVKWHFYPFDKLRSFKRTWVNKKILAPHKEAN